MLDGLYGAAAGMEAQQEQIDAHLQRHRQRRHARLPGDAVGFHDLLYTSGGASSGRTVATGAGAAAEIVGRSQAQGAIQPTGQPLDVAISGQGYLEVRRPDGTIGLTRNGALQVDARAD